MQLAIISDVDAKIEGLQEMHDKLWVLVYLVRLRPESREEVEFVRSMASVIVRRNNDHTVASREKPRCETHGRPSSLKQALLRRT